MLYPRSLFSPPIVRLRVTPDEPAEGPPAIVEQRPRGSRRPHTDMAVAKVRHLIEHTGLTYSEITKKTGVGRASISRWTRDGLEALAERHLRELEQMPAVDPDRLMQALQLVKMTRLEAMGRRRRRRLVGPTYTGMWAFERDALIRTALKEMQRGGVDIDRAPKEAVDLVIEANVPVPDYPELRERGRRSKRNREHAWLREKE
jgi:transcriptional regulator with XRE-family HTH domain